MTVINLKQETGRAGGQPQVELVKFPYRARVMFRKGLNFKDKRCELDIEIREIDAAIAALRARKRTLLIEYRRELCAGLGGVVALSLIVAGHYAASSLPLSPASMPVSASSTTERLSGLNAAIRFAIAHTPSWSLGSRNRSPGLQSRKASAKA
jgi:hypothetical protein